MVCLTCHEKGKQANWHGGVHERRGLSCISCHSVHDYQSEQHQLKTARDPETCFTCHAAIRAKGLRTSHHPVREGLMTCASCHNPHDGTKPKMITADVDQREVPRLPHREARAVPLGARAGPRELPQLPRPPRLQPRQDARRQAALPLPALPPEHAPSRHALRRAATRLGGGSASATARWSTPARTATRTSTAATPVGRLPGEVAMKRAVFVLRARGRRRPVLAQDAVPDELPVRRDRFRCLRRGAKTRTPRSSWSTAKSPTASCCPFPPRRAEGRLPLRPLRLGRPARGTSATASGSRRAGSASTGPTSSSRTTSATAP